MVMVHDWALHEGTQLFIFWLYIMNSNIIWMDLKAMNLKAST